METVLPSSENIFCNYPSIKRTCYPIITKLLQVKSYWVKNHLFLCCMYFPVVFLCVLMVSIPFPLHLFCFPHILQGRYPRPRHDVLPGITYRQLVDASWTMSDSNAEDGTVRWRHTFVNSSSTALSLGGGPIVRYGGNYGDSNRLCRVCSFIHPKS